ncbi:hypothetical protein CAC42_2417 [Sphaceloma murrayae]|uniref:AAA+ ATPase domain-containing protein n=1 Tax=Sphaceloma murrayae TaxID=2082308 RepID=A0A2K1QWA8_9PEZI|nr:hypothetical protein CAC42_2417 [Sphaceloma murrayae]
MAHWPISSRPSDHQRKRRRLDHGEGGQDTTARTTVAKDAHNYLDSHHAVEASGDGSLVGEASSKHAAAMPPTTPKKMLKLNKSGKLGSPSSDQTGAQVNPVQAKKRGRPRKVQQPRSRVVTILYSTEGLLGDGSVARRIDRILRGEERYTRPVPKPREITPAHQAGPPKAAHPFFTSRIQKPLESSREHVMPAPAKESPRKSSAATPGKIRQQVQQMKALQNRTDGPSNQLAPTSKPTTQRTEVWPLIGSMHIRGPMQPFTCSWMLPLGRRKHKTQKPRIEDSSSILKAFRPDELLRGHKEGLLRSDGFSDPHPDLRVPSRRLLTGLELLDGVSAALFNTHQHQALKNIASSLPSYLNAYDEGRADQLPWTHKYAPANAASVLQTGNEPTLLRDWMRALTVLSTTMQSTTTVLKDNRPRKKRRKKNDDLDDFIVSSGDEADQLGSLTEVDEPGSQGSKGDGASRSMVRSVLEGLQGEVQKTANTVVLSGPHGCGKTAMVLAVAKELNFQVFEINAGSRRSGRDILERIGDVVGNHIVSHEKADAGNMSADEDAARHSAALQKDLDSGRQGTMNSFFKSRAVKQANMPLKKKVPISSKPKAEPARHQKQSIILLEEVDVLFEEDKSFWTTVLSLIATSRRPIVMTCTSESSLPLDDLVLHAILRLAPPPTELATDYLLLLAAQEGHLIQRDAAVSLYQHKKCDLRASITELQFWCQMGVGDPRGGLSWIFQRWPPGTGMDADGNVQRVTSNGTYHTGMGWLASDESDCRTEDSKAEELMTEAWVDWALDPRDECHTEAASQISDHTSRKGDATSKLTSLLAMDRFADTLSALACLPAMDLPCRRPRSRYSPLGSALDTPLDPTLPPLTSKQLASYTDSPRFLQADPMLQHNHLSRDLCVTATHLLNKTQPFPARQHREVSPPSALTASHHARILDPPPPSTIPLPAHRIYAALQPLSTALLQTWSYTFHLSPLPVLTVDMAPYVRAIVAHDARRERERRELHALLHGAEAGEGKMRRTRAARGALEGKGREEVKREKWWDVGLEEEAVRVTGGEGWGASLGEWVERKREELEREREEEEVRVGGVKGVVDGGKDERAQGGNGVGAAVSGSEKADHTETMWRGDGTQEVVMPDA